MTRVMHTWPLLLLLLAPSDRTATIEHTPVIDRVVELIRERYVYEEVAKRCTAQLQERHARGDSRVSMTSRLPAR